MKKVLITGINGFLGSHIAKKLRGFYEIIGIEYSVENLWRLNRESFEVYTSDDLSLKNIFENNEIFAIIHAATVYRIINDSVIDIISTNILLPIRLYELADKYNVSIFLNTDSFFNDKKHQYSYLSEYTQSKNDALEWLKLLNVNSGCKLINMKIFHMYGSDDALTKFIPQIISKTKENIPFIDLTEGNQTRDFIYINDVVDAYITVLNNNAKISHFQEFEVGTGKVSSIKKLVELIKELTSSSTELRFGQIPYREGEIMESQAKNTSLILLNWVANYSLKDGLAKMLLDEK